MSEPETYHRGKILSINKKVNANTYQTAEHTRELKSLKERMEKIGSWQHRKKNGSDPLANPVWFFKGKNRDPELEKALDLSHFEQKLKEKYLREQAQYKVIQEEIIGKKPQEPIKAGKKRASYTNTWKTQVRDFDSKNNPAKDDYQDLSNKIRPAETIFKERPQPDYTKSKAEDEEAE